RHLFARHLAPEIQEAAPADLAARRGQRSLSRAARLNVGNPGPGSAFPSSAEPGGVVFGSQFIRYVAVGAAALVVVVGAVLLLQRGMAPPTEPAAAPTATATPKTPPPAD